mgnify:CR=1 FL=1|tara:strand:+ start:674 stop:958 length:285 start_codon:yes stop_codon:yes gene_type:complete
MSNTILIILINLVVVILGIGIYAIINLVKKNEKLEDIAIKQNEYIVSITSIIKESDKKLQEIDSRGTFQSDDEIGWFFKQVKEIQDIINEYKIQ